MTIEAHVTINATKVAVWSDTTDSERFAWVSDPEGNKVELWEPK